MDVNVKLEWKGNMAFEAEVDGHIIPLDADAKVEGNDLGPRPKKLLLAALGGCTSMDIVSILKKMRVSVDKLSLNVESSQTEDEHPYVYEYFKIVFNFEGESLEADAGKIEKAVALSHDKYCGVSAMLSKSAPVTYEIWINGKMLV